MKPQVWIALGLLTIGCSEERPPSPEQAATESSTTLPGRASDGGAPSKAANPQAAQDGGADKPAPPQEDKGEGDPAEVITMGDSYMRTAGFGPKMGAELSLEKASGRDFRNFAGGSAFKAVAVLNGVIPGQFERAKVENATIKTIVIAAGGNDLTDDCNGAATEEALTEGCKGKTDEIAAAIEKMFTDFAAGGVEDVMWLGYGEITSQQKVLNGAIQRLNRLRKEKCVATASPRCHFIETKEALQGKIGKDGFHPTAEGYDLLGQIIWDRMKKEGVRR